MHPLLVLFLLLTSELAKVLHHLPRVPHHVHGVLELRAVLGVPTPRVCVVRVRGARLRGSTRRERAVSDVAPVGVDVGVVVQGLLAEHGEHVAVFVHRGPVPVGALHESLPPVLRLSRLDLRDRGVEVDLGGRRVLVKLGVVTIQRLEGRGVVDDFLDERHVRPWSAALGAPNGSENGLAPDGRNSVD